MCQLSCFSSRPRTTRLGCWGTPYLVLVLLYHCYRCASCSAYVTSGSSDVVTVPDVTHLASSPLGTILRLYILCKGSIPHHIA